ncbi:DUF3987 domain-containing protein [Chelatococcus reniformis]|uniref:DNA primase/polymerase bifunctional N-terminal domain-containing protein n=1 Tax=Chelatococcus reniformis TaxID=1494448 RepID=A0A916XEQ1_9HYPH|nr:DUF3987 domain-containing protein [Chelatococcus reniformis]GGC68434.1 hypothetical protein GCM10010994_28760 [Chelatococcus reniformis]
MAEQGAYSQVGAKLVERGYAAIPIMPGTKRPGEIRGREWVGMWDWQGRYSKRLPTEYEVGLWSDGDGGVCVVTGPASHDLIGIDIDVDDEPIVAAIKGVLPPTPVSKTGQKGETLFFRGPGVPSRSFTEYLPDGKRGRRLCDLIGPGRQTVLPPTIHPDTKQPYRWIAGEALENVDPDELPVLPPDIGDRIAEALSPFGYRPEPSRQHVRQMTEDADNPFRSLNDMAMANLPDWVPRLGLYKCQPYQGGYRAVATWRASYGGRPLEKRSPNLKIHPQGIRDFHDDRSYTPIDLVQEACGIADAGDAFRHLSEMLGLTEGLAFDLRPRASYTLTEDGTLIDEDGVVVRQGPAPAPPEPRPAGTSYDEAILASDTLVGDIARWILYVARRPQPRFAVAAALALVGTASSRQLVTPTFSNLNLYVLITTRSGNGKDAPMKAVKSVLGAARLDEMIGPDGAASDVGLLDYANRQPASIMSVDEFGDFIAATTGQRAAPHTLKIMAAMRTLWDGGAIKTTHALTRGSVLLRNPCVSMICASTPGQFYDAIGSAQVLNGFLNRFLLVNAAGDAPRGADDRDIADVPPAIVDGILSIANRPGGMTAARFRTSPAEDQFNERPYRVPWRDEAARARWMSYEDHNLARMKDDASIEAFAPRCAQNALKLATIMAIGENAGDPTVSREHVELGIEIAEASLCDMLAGYNNHVPESATASLAAKALQRIKDAGGEMSRRDLFRSMKRAFKKTQELDDLMKTLVEAGDIVVVATAPEGGGKTTFSYHVPG